MKTIIALMIAFASTQAVAGTWFDNALASVFGPKLKFSQQIHKNIQLRKEGKNVQYVIKKCPAPGYNYDGYFLGAIADIIAEDASVSEQEVAVEQLVIMSAIVEQCPQD